MLVPSNPMQPIFPKKNDKPIFCGRTAVHPSLFNFCVRKNVTNLHTMKIRNTFQKSLIPHLLPAVAVRRFGIFQKSKSEVISYLFGKCQFIHYHFKVAQSSLMAQRFRCRVHLKCAPVRNGPCSFMRGPWFESVQGNLRPLCCFDTAFLQFVFLVNWKSAHREFSLASASPMMQR